MRLPASQEDDSEKVKRTRPRRKVLNRELAFVMRLARRVPATRLAADAGGSIGARRRLGECGRSISGRTASSDMLLDAEFATLKSLMTGLQFTGTHHDAEVA